MKTIIKLGFFVVIFGCFKNEDPGGLATKINLTVVDEFTNETLAGEKLELLRCPSGHDLYSLFESCGLFSNLISDSLGNTEFEFITDPDKYYKLEYRPFGYSKSAKHQSPVSYLIDEGKENNIIFKLRPTTQVGVHLIHSPSNDVQFRYSVERITENDMGPSDYLGFSGKTFRELDTVIDTIIYRAFMQDEYYTIIGRLQQSESEKKEIKKTFNVVRVDTLIIDFEF